MTRTKICGITRAQDVKAAARSGADALGMVFCGRSPRHISAHHAARLLESVPPFVTLVGLFVNPGENEVREVLSQVALDLLQFHGEETPEFCAQFGRPFLKAIRVRPGVDLIQCAARYAGAQGLLLDAHVNGTHGGTGVAFDWGLIPHDLPLPIVLSGGLHAGNVAEAIRQVRPYAVDVSSGVEADRGIKDADKIAAFINEVKLVDSGINRSEQA